MCNSDQILSNLGRSESPFENPAYVVQHALMFLDLELGAYLGSVNVTYCHDLKRRVALF